MFLKDRLITVLDFEHYLNATAGWWHLHFGIHVVTITLVGPVSAPDMVDIQERVAAGDLVLIKTIPVWLRFFIPNRRVTYERL